LTYNEVTSAEAQRMSHEWPNEEEEEKITQPGRGREDKLEEETKAEEEEHRERLEEEERKDQRSIRRSGGSVRKR